MFDNKIINIITRTLGAIFLSILLIAIFKGIINIIIFYNLQTIILIGFVFVLYLIILAIICVCIGEFIVWILDKIYK